ncbi:MAG: chromosomal replication initiator protein DnaA [bacterium]|nr:chromosomal replication initiator protein DnaA [bacterium]
MDELWKSVLGEIELEQSISEATFKTFFAETKLLKIDENIAIIGLKNSFLVRSFRNKYYNLIAETLAKNGHKPSRIDFEIIREDSKKKTRESRKISADDLISKSRNRTSRTEDLTSLRSNRNSDGLNPRYTFENFIVGASNDLAFAAAQNVAKNPGEKYNPLYIYGGVGLGKTHLMQAIGNEIKKNHPDLRILYTTIENFYKDYLESVRFRKQGYADKYRNVDVLIVDDMQFIAGKEKSQEEFFHTFNELHQANKQIIISSDRAPKSIPTLTDRLRSRFEWGMPIDIQLPDIETRQAIIEAKSEQGGYHLDPETVQFLASNIRTNIRELEGTLNQLAAIAELRGIQPDVDMARGLITSESRNGNSRKSLTAKKIIDKVCKFYNVSREDILSKSRTKDINHARQVACYLMKFEIKMSFPAIGKEFSRDHTTIMNGVSKIEKGVKFDIEVREQINALSELIYE